jgi:hypothetical protein
MDIIRRNRAIQAIESSSFEQKSFTTGPVLSNKAQAEQEDAFTFGTAAEKASYQVRNSKLQIGRHWKDHFNKTENASSHKPRIFPKNCLLFVYFLFTFCLLFVYFLFTFVYICLLFVYFCLHLFTFVYICLLLFTFVYFCLLLFTFVYFCLLL